MSCSGCVVAGIETSELAALSFDPFPFAVRRPTGHCHTARLTTFAADALDARVAVRFERGALRHGSTLTVDTPALTHAVFTFCTVTTSLSTIFNHT